MLIDFSLFRRAGRAEMMRIVSSWRTSAQQRAVVIVRCIQLLLLVLSSAVESTKQKNGSKKTSQAPEGYIVLAQIDCCLLGIPFKVCPRSSSLVSTNCSVYTCITRQALNHSGMRRVSTQPISPASAAWRVFWSGESTVSPPAVTGFR